MSDVDPVAFHVPFRVRFDEAAPDGRLRTSSALRYAQDLAWQHSADRGFDRAWYDEHALTWMVRAARVACLSAVVACATGGDDAEGGQAGRTVDDLDLVLVPDQPELEAHRQGIRAAQTLADKVVAGGVGAGKGCGNGIEVATGLGAVSSSCVPLAPALVGFASAVAGGGAAMGGPTCVASRSMALAVCASCMACVAKLSKSTALLLSGASARACATSAMV